MISNNELEFLNCVKQSNEILIPKPLAICFNLQAAIPSPAYLADMRRELELKSRIFDRDRAIHRLYCLNPGGDSPTHSLEERVVDLSMSFFRFDQDYKSIPLDEITEIASGLDVIGVGLGAISRIEDIFFRNTTNPDRYHARLANWRIPVT